MERAVNVAPLIGRLHARLAEYYSLVNNNYAKAATEYRKAITLTPNDVVALIGATSLYGVPDEVVSLDEAIAWQEHAISLEPDNPNYHVRLAGFYEEGGRALDAVREWTLALLCPQPLEQRSMPKIESALLI
jgi:tetratricopeptide (TPR) repeat protein